MARGNLLEVSHLTKSYKRKEVLKEVGFYIKPAEIVGFIGPNGAGKTTTMKCICNLVYPDKGSIIIDGYDIARHRDKAIASLAAIIESPGLFLELTGRENIKMIAELKGINVSRVDEIVNFIGIGSNIDRKVAGYSMGMKQRLGLGIAILGKPKLLILDEPTNGLDPSAVIVLRNTLKNLVESEGISILFSSHQLGEVEKLADRILFINDGVITEMPSQIYANSRYFIRCENGKNALSIINNTCLNVSCNYISNDTISVDVISEQMFNEILCSLINGHIAIYDISKETIDVETIYKSIYGERND